MKKFVCLTLIALFNFMPTITLAELLSSNEIEIPKWEEYVPKKYQNPRSFPSKGKNIAELSVGILLTDLLITAPIGIPMIVHSTTKMKNQGWYEKKKIYENGLVKAEQITDLQEKQEFYEKLKKQCKFKETNREKYLKNLAKNEKQDK